MAWLHLLYICCLVAMSYPICVSCKASRFKLSDLKASLNRKPVAKTASTTLAPFKFDFIINQPTTPKPKRGSYHRRRCCRIGKMAARLGYTCYITRNIALIRVNMPQRQKMKMVIKGDKWGYPFAKQMEFCAKTLKHTRKFNRCCDKEAREMDKEKFKK